ncbi:hypothetical protein ADLECEL_20020 [Adlercreutzia equolifaciens subsp. celatus]|nr:hypothetical protein ADLECEL_20020 [Adlercreutzia equolifaciens subsp. celatus]
MEPDAGTVCCCKFINKVWLRDLRNPVFNSLYWRSKEGIPVYRSIYAKSVLDRANGSRIRD